MSQNIKEILLIFLFFILQVIWFNHVQILHRYSPIIFIYPLLHLPIKQNENMHLMLAFLLGIAIDIVSNTGGVFAATAVLVTYTRKLYFMFSKNRAYNMEDIQIDKITGIQRYLYYFTFIFFSQLLIYFFESWNMSLLIQKITLILVNSLISLLFFILIDIIFYKAPKV